MNFFWSDIARPSVAEGDEAVGLDAGLDQLAEPGDPEARRQHLVLDAATQRRGDADDQVDAVLLGQLRPPRDDVAVVLRRLGEPRRVVHPVVVEEHAADLVPLGDRGLAEQVGRVARLVLVGPFVDQNAELHSSAAPQKRMCADAFRLDREPRQSSIRYLVNGSPVFSKKRGQPMRSIQSAIRSHGRASSLYVYRILRTTSPTSGQRGGLLGSPLATIFMNVGLPRAFEFFPPTQIASFECSGWLICIGGHGG